MKCLIYFGMSSMKEGTSAQLSGRGVFLGGARVTTLVTLRKCTLGNKREIKTLKFVSAWTKGFKGGLAWIKPSKKDMAVTFSYSSQPPQLCTTCPSPIRIAAVVMVFFRLPQGKIFLATIDIVAPVSPTPRYSRPPSRIRTQNTRSWVPPERPRQNSAGQVTSSPVSAICGPSS